MHHGIALRDRQTAQTRIQRQNTAWKHPQKQNTAWNLPYRLGSGYYATRMHHQRHAREHPQEKGCGGETPPEKEWNEDRRGLRNATVTDTAGTGKLLTSPESYKCEELKAASTMVGSGRQRHRMPIPRQTRRLFRIFMQNFSVGRNTYASVTNAFTLLLFHHIINSTALLALQTFSSI